MRALLIREMMTAIITLPLLAPRLKQLGRFADMNAVDAEAHVRTRVLVADDAFVHQIKLPQEIVCRNCLVGIAGVAGVMNGAFFPCSCKYAYRKAVRRAATAALPCAFC